MEIGVSVIVMVYDAPQTLQVTIQAILRQTYAFWEIIIIDDFSKDNTSQIVQEWACKNSRIKIIQTRQNGGLLAARNLGLDIARGQWVAVVDSGDEILPQRFATMLAAAHNEVDLIFDNPCYITPPYTREHHYIPSSFDGYGPLSLETFILLLQRSIDIPNLGFLKPFMRREILENKNIRYKIDLKNGADEILVMDLMACGAKSVLLPNILFCHLHHACSIVEVKSRKGILATNQIYEDFLDRHYGEIEAGVIRAMRELINDNKCRIAVGEIISDIYAFRWLAALCELTSDISLAAPVIKYIIGQLIVSCKNVLNIKHS